MREEKKEERRARKGRRRKKKKRRKGALLAEREGEREREKRKKVPSSPLAISSLTNKVTSNLYRFSNKTRHKGLIFIMIFANKMK
jgi:hypothetical protein